jgi:LmbE family N-acetylglucosaminyl deacetylase
MLAKKIFNKILFLGPHTDDELACSGTLCKFMEEGSEIFVAVFSFCEESIPSEFPKDILYTEFNEAMNVLKINPGHIFRYHFKVRYFPSNRQEILEQLIILKNIIQPDLVLLPTPTDIHQDHNTISQEGVRAFHKTSSSIFGYHHFQNTTGFYNNGFIEIKQKHLDIKIKSLNCYKSQYEKNKNFINRNVIETMARMNGFQADMEMAETFEIIKLKI